MSRKRRTVEDEVHFAVRTAVADLPGGSVVSPHRHDWHQLIHIATGLMTVTTDAGSWVTPPHCALWVPAGVRHSIRFLGTSALRTAYVRPDRSDVLPRDCCVIAVSPLLRELVLRATEVGMLDDRDADEAAIATLIVGELRVAKTPPFTLPQPTSPALRRAARLLVARRPEAAVLGEVARTVGIATRTFERRFLAETGMTPGHWRRQQVLLSALEQLAIGASTKAVAIDAGYATPSAFVAAFRRAFGTTPTRYFRREPDAGDASGRR